MKKVLKTIGIIILAIICIALVALILEEVRTKHTQDDYSDVYTDVKYQTPVKIENLEVITQDVSCGYAVIECFLHGMTVM